ncbi:ADP-ribose pyrophosphatase YjhB, NUDIX family [Thermomonospora echinospora]|uniref:ADP-ribose pyrophosphatase YjhB, NUDIX family n=1 Tax=Thermomonospora echinospora TaxID=1992 RepID=A0A1H6D251_9ACTN|nr:NUDIX domain-containing protein [Thermomonospora echinospora]SEG78963.1 ADP-ribose pyrophosphatase YjhB, NUDIX family [Thermomonospora echinospora]
MTTGIAAPQTAAHAVLTDHRGLVLLVNPAYKNRWHLPGGYLRPGELPSAAVTREITEELAITPALPPAPAVIAWAPHGGDRLLLYYAAELNTEQARSMQIDGHELVGFRWCAPTALDEWLHPAIADRARLALEASRRGQTLFLEPHRPSQ